MTTFYKIKNKLAPPYLLNHITEHRESNINLRVRITRVPFSRTKRHVNSFFPYCIKEWNNLDESVKSPPWFTGFKEYLNKFIRPKGNSFYGIKDAIGIKLLTKIRVEFSDLKGSQI